MPLEVLQNWVLIQLLVTPHILGKVQDQIKEVCRLIEPCLLIGTREYMYRQAECMLEKRSSIENFSLNQTTKYLKNLSILSATTSLLIFTGSSGGGADGDEQTVAASFVPLTVDYRYSKFTNVADNLSSMICYKT